MLNIEFLKVSALAIKADGTYTPFSGDAIKYALEMTLLGMGMIFAVLGILWGVLILFKLIFAKPKKEKKTVEVPKVESAPAVVEESVPVVTPTPASTDDGEMIAILTAAIIAYEVEQNPDATIANFKVVSYRRTNGGRSWNAK